MPIAPNSYCFLIEIENPEGISLDDLRDILKEIEATINYTDIYGTLQEPVNKSFQYFDRKNDKILFLN